MQQITKLTAVEQVESSLIALIQSDDYHVGDKLPTEKQLCEELGVGRGTIREAVRILQAKGYVENRPGRGAFLARKYPEAQVDVAEWFRMNEDDLKDLTEIRTAIEPVVVKLAIRNCT